MRVRLQTPSAHLVLEAKLAAAIAARCEALVAEGVPPGDAAGLRKRLAEMQVCVVEELKRSIAVVGAAAATGKGAAEPADSVPAEWEFADEDLDAMPALVPALQELQQIEDEVASLAARCASQREAVPQQLLTDIEGELKTLRPTEPEPTATPAADENADAAADGADAAAQAQAQAQPQPQPQQDALAPSPAALRKRLSAAVTAFPSLRAKLEAALERLGRVVDAVERRKTSVTEAALAELDENVAEERPAGVSPAFKDALKEGKINTRKRLASRELKASLAREGSVDM